MGSRSKCMLKRTCKAGLASVVAYAAWRLYQSKRRAPENPGGWQPQPFPYPPVPRASSDGDAHLRPHVPVDMTPGGGPEIDDEGVSVVPWMEPVGGGCPASHPVKAKLASGIYHEPGGASYERTQPDRCYLDAESAQADGLRPSKR